VFVPYYYVGVMGGYERRWGEDPDPRQRERWLRGAYEDVPLATRLRDGELVSSSSQPSLMATMLVELEVRDGDTVLEIGAGTGYNAALLSHRLGDDHVTTVDLDPEITESARRHLDAAGYHPTVVTGDGARGVPERAPFDRIIATCALPSVPRAWLAQCAPGGRILTPLATGLVLLRVADAAHAEGRFLDTPAYFVPLRGATPSEPPLPRLEGLPRRARGDDLFRFLLTLTAGSLDPHEAYDLWEREGEPPRERYGITVDGDRAWSWLDDPEGPYVWPLP
jgi:protein-L-isoaspartate(D-aspartate) O-methyltransferase